MTFLYLQQFHLIKILCRMYGLVLIASVPSSKVHLSIQIVVQICQATEYLSSSCAFLISCQHDSLISLEVILENDEQLKTQGLSVRIQDYYTKLRPLKKVNCKECIFTATFLTKGLIISKAILQENEYVIRAQSPEETTPINQPPAEQ